MTKDQPEGYLGSLQSDAERARQKYVDGEIDEDELEKELDSERVLREDREWSRRRHSRSRRQWLALFATLILTGVLIMQLTAGGVPL